MRLVLRLIPLIVIALFAGAIAAPTGHAAKSPRLVYLDLFAQPEEKPKRIFVFANSTPYLDKLKWEGWGTGKAKAVGIFVSECSLCPPPKRRTATLVYRTVVGCRKEGVRVYRSGRLTTGADYTNKRKTIPFRTGIDHC